MLYGTQIDNRPYAPEEAGFPDQWNKEFAYPSITTSTMVEFFDYMERNFAGSFATIKGDGGAWWEEMAAADALYAGISRKVKERALAAEEVASLGSIVNPNFHFPLEDDQSIWNNLLFYTNTLGEHQRRGHIRKVSPRRSCCGTKNHSPNRLTSRRTICFAAASVNWPTRSTRRGSRSSSLIPSRGRAATGGSRIEPRQGLIDSKTRQAVPLELVRRVEGEAYDNVRFLGGRYPSSGIPLLRDYAVGFAHGGKRFAHFKHAGERILQGHHRSITRWNFQCLRQTTAPGIGGRRQSVRFEPVRLRRLRA